MLQVAAAVNVQIREHKINFPPRGLDELILANAQCAATQRCTGVAWDRVDPSVRSTGYLGPCTYLTLGGDPKQAKSRKLAKNAAPQARSFTNSDNFFDSVRKR